MENGGYINMNEEDINKQIKALQSEKHRLERIKEEAQYPEWVKLIQGGSVDESELFDDLLIWGGVDMIRFNLHWKEAPHNSEDYFIHDEFKYIDNGSYDDGRIHKWRVSRVDGKKFTYDELKEIIPDFEEICDGRRRGLLNKLKALRKLRSKSYE